MEELFLGVITLFAIYFLYKKLFTKKGCGTCEQGCETKK